MVILIAVIFRLTLMPKLVQLAQDHAEANAVGCMEGHATMDMAVEGGESFFSSPDRVTLSLEQDMSCSLKA